MNKGIAGAGFQLLAGRYYSRLLTKGPDPEASKLPAVPENKVPVVGVTLSIGATPKEPDTNETKLPEGWRTKQSPLDALARTTEQVLADGEDAQVLKERPKSEDPTRLALTEQANQFALGEGDNPFSGFSRQTLSSIAYDDSGTYTTTEIAAAMREIQGDDKLFWDETYKRIDEAAIKNDNDDDSKPMELKAWIKLLSGMSEAEKATLDFTNESLSIELNDWEQAGFDVPDAVDYPELTEPEATVLAATTDKNGKAIWKQYAVSLLSAHTTQLKLLSDLPTEPQETNPSADTNAKGQWLQIYAEIERF